MIRVKRAYDTAEAADGERFLVDRLWPRGVTKEVLRLAGWLREVAPSDELRRWFGHDPDRWAEFQRRYGAELDGKPESWQPLLEAAARGDITLVYGTKDTQHNNAAALKSYLEARRAEDGPPDPG
ncbi:MAG: DUF488 domain-containing protein [Caldilineales bacterium]|nr:DUF488 domain-containing protein [Caldilineales bacterium]MCW5857462.1 DUF488 domain-containing protein [Caldilineales bacterium]